MSRDTRIDVDRRVFLKAAAWSTIAATVALKACASPPEDSSGVMYDPSGLTEDLELFDLGVQSGLTSTGALLWTHRSTDASLQVRVWLEGGPLVLDAPVETEGAFIKVAVEELSPGARYRYVFVHGSDAEASLAHRRLRVPPASDELEPFTPRPAPAPTRVGCPSSRWRRRRVRSSSVLHLGDISYNDDATDRASYDEAWALPEIRYRALLPRAAFIPVVDDHEIADNFVVTELPAEQLADGLAALYDHLPIDGSPGDSLWTSHRWGLTAELFVLDGRLERRRDEGLYMSEAQLSWLIDGLQSSPCHFKIVLNAVPIAELPPAWPAFTDRWEAFATQRDAVLDAVTEGGLTNVWFLTGDLHAGLVHRIERSDRTRRSGGHGWARGRGP